MDQSIRNKLRNVVTQCRRLLEEAVAHVLQGQFGIHATPKNNEVFVEDESHLRTLSEEDKSYRRDILAHFEHIQAQGYRPKDCLAQLIREIAFTHLNRLCAYKMMEAREVWIRGQRFREAVSRGLKSQGFQFYLADHPDDKRRFDTGQQDVAYRHFLGWLGALLSEEIGVLFSPTDPANRLFPPQRVLDEVLSLLNSDDLKDIWTEDETIGWVYQYFTPKELRDQARKESAAPRNSYELAFRNQFFTPRYVVEFLTDNTLGRIWYEMRMGRTTLTDNCRYLVRQPDEVFLAPSTCEGHEHFEESCGAIAKLLVEGDEDTFPPFSANDDNDIQRMISLSHCVSAYQRLGDDCWSWRETLEPAINGGDLDSVSTQEILDFLFLTCRSDRHSGDGSVYRERWFAAAANEVRRRVLQSREEIITQERLLKCPVVVPYRTKKDPRDIRILDPACGSGHFLLYCFDLLLSIYEEAYVGPDFAPKLKEEYPTLEALQRDVPRLILAHNLHGIDIDLRATQIAALALWLRCQRAYGEIELNGDRPRITKANIACGEPMPGENEMLKEFVAQLQPKVLSHLVEIVFDKMKLAGEAGSLLKIEEELRDAIAEAKKRWVAEHEQATDRKGRPLLFSKAELERLANKTPQPQLFDFSDITDEQFWNEAESQVLTTLRNYAAHASNGGKLKRQLFAEDAERGFAFIDTCQKVFDVVLMNPPFGSGTSFTASYLSHAYPRSTNDLYSACVERGISLLLAEGMLGAITSRTGLFLSSFKKWREELLIDDTRVSVLADLGFGVLDAAKVETAAYCLSASKTLKRSIFFRLLGQSNTSQALFEAVSSLPSGNAPSFVFLAIPESFRQIPGSPFAYWVSEKVRRLFKTLPAFESDGRAVKQGLATADDFRFVRAWWEVPANRIVTGEIDTTEQDFRRETTHGSQWVPIVKGGVNTPFHGDVTLVANWHDDGRELKDFPGSVIRNPDYYFRPGITWPARPWLRGFFSFVPAGALFSHTGMMLFLPKEDRLAVCSILNSDAYAGLLHLLMARGMGVDTDQTLKYEVGYISSVPIPDFDASARMRLELLSNRCREQVCFFDTVRETSHFFIAPAVTQEKADSLSAVAVAWSHRAANASSSVDECRQAINEIAFELYGIDSADRKSLEDGLDKRTAANTSNGHEDAGDAEDDLRASGIAPDMISYCVGGAFGRWDFRVATGEDNPIECSSPFSPLRAFSPGMLRDSDQASTKQAIIRYPLRIDSDGIIPDDPDHSDDIVGRVRDALELIWIDRAEDIEKESCAILGIKELRDYFRKSGTGGFWDEHISRYSKSRRKAPIYWLLQSSKKNYGLWLYYHRLDKDILFKALLNYVEPKNRLEQSRLDSLRAEKTALGAAAKKIDKDIERQEGLLVELKDFEEKLRRAAHLDFGKNLESSVIYDPDLNDGVVLNIAPLWELVPWREAKDYWDQLIAGNYEWSSMGKLLRKKGLV